MDDELKRKQRRAYWPLRLVLASKTYCNETMKLSLAITKGDFDGEAIYNELRDAKAELLADLDACEEKVCETIWFESQPSDKTTYGFEEWKRRMAMRRHTKQVIERRRAKNQET